MRVCALDPTLITFIGSIPGMMARSIEKETGKQGCVSDVSVEGRGGEGGVVRQL